MAPQDDPLEERITADDKVRFGKPVIRGTRITVDEVVGLVASGMDRDEVAAEYGIEVADVDAALAARPWTTEPDGRG